VVVISIGRNGKRATILDIAKEAKVSTATVSRVLNNLDYPVTEALRKRVIEVSERLDYHPNIFSQMLKGGTSNEIGIIVPSISNPFYAQLVADTERICLKNSYIPIICSSYNSPQLENNHLEMLTNKQVAGIILSTINLEGIISRLSSFLSPCVLFDQPSEGYHGDSITFDFYKSGYMATSYLIENGHRRIAFVSPPIDRTSRRYIYKGYREALRDHGIRLSSKWVFVAANGQHQEMETQDYQNGRLLAGTLLNAPYLPDAVLAINDIIAIGIMSTLTERNVQIPNDLSLIGFDDIAFSSMVTPALTTVRQSTTQTAGTACKLLFDRIQNPQKEAVHVKIEPEIIVRSTVRKIHPKVKKQTDKP